MIKQIIDNQKAKTKKDIYRLTHPLEAIKENVSYTKRVVLGNYDSYTPSAQSVLNKYGNEIINNIVLHRNPLSKNITTLLSTWTGKELDKRLKNEPKDELFHVGIWITLTSGKVIKVEKNANINLEVNPRKPKEEQSSQNVPKPKNLTLGELLENTRRKVGNQKFFSYSAKNNNCSMFIEMILKANNLNTEATHAYINQDTKKLLDGFPKMRQLMNSVTDLAGRFDYATQQDNNLPTEKYKPITIQEPIEEPVEENVEPQETIIEGDGLKRRTNTWITHCKTVAKQKGITYKQAMIEAKQTYKK